PSGAANGAWVTAFEDTGLIASRVQDGDQSPDALSAHRRRTRRQSRISGRSVNTISCSAREAGVALDRRCWHSPSPVAPLDGRRADALLVVQLPGVTGMEVHLAKCRTVACDGYFGAADRLHRPCVVTIPEHAGEGGGPDQDRLGRAAVAARRLCRRRPHEAGRRGGVRG